ncbi:Putative ATPase [Malassezia cuniculi]|uniref:ATPase n=1 Tax=Malassezia cuniculi TaxID=948313 RepID=A0AAF0J571_9BASI|nr:Putative ATPase [Malassezia cuniculi]
MSEDDAERVKKLEMLLQRSGIYSRIMGEKLAKRSGQPRAKKARLDGEQAAICTATLKPYQKEGLVWLTSLYENGLNGILADEMGLGKTLQTISFIAHLRENGVTGPFLVVAPLSTTHNWCTEFAKFAPSIPVLLYHGTKDKRTALRRQLTAKRLGDGISVLVTSYEIVLADKRFLGKHEWKYLVVDEGHRLKNLDCKLLRELKAFSSSNRLIITGTPLHNNLSELWALLNFILPDIFDDLAAFERWFNLEGANDVGVNASFSSWSSETARRVVGQLHDILRPFLLRRVKSEVEHSLPPKKEYLLYAPMSSTQAAMYNHAAQGRLREYLVEVLSDKKQVNSIPLQNDVMQLRKISCHPYLIHWPDAPPIDQLEKVSGKMRMLGRLLDGLFERGHRVLVFSQFTTMLDIIELWATQVRQLEPYRIDGRTPQEERVEQMSSFNAQCDDKRRGLFLLNTRAGGLGINLVGADTVVFFDSDWNPQMDLQAQDRVHRLGQTKPVLVFRLVSADTIEQHILLRAQAKRQLESVVMEKGKFRRPIDYVGVYDDDVTPAGPELEAKSLCVGSESVISDADLARLLDRSEEAYARESGWHVGGAGRTLFEVTVTANDGDASSALVPICQDDD